MGDDSIDTVIFDIDMGYLVTLAHWLRRRGWAARGGGGALVGHRGAEFFILVR